MAFDAFLKLVTSTGTTVSGESLDKVHAGEIELTGYNLGTTHPSTVGSATGGAGAGKATFSDFSFTTSVSKVSPALFQACTQGTRCNQAIVTLRKAGGKAGAGAGVEFLKITMATVFVSAYQSGGAVGDEVPHDDVHLAYGSIHFQYVPQKPDGSAGPPVAGGWDVQKNAPA